MDRRVCVSVCGKNINRNNAKISQAALLTTRKPGFPFHSLRTNQTRQQQLKQAAQVAAAASSASASATASAAVAAAAASIYEPTACGKHNRKRQQAAPPPQHLLRLSSSAVSVICIKWQPLVGAPYFCGPRPRPLQLGSETMHINHDGSSSACSMLLYTRL